MISTLRCATASRLRRPGFALLVVVTLGMGIAIEVFSDLATILGLGELAFLWMLIWGAKGQLADDSAAPAPIPA